MNRWKAAAAHVALIATAYCACPVATSGDSRWTVPVALNLLEHGSTSLEPYAAIAFAEPAYRWECIPQQHQQSIARAACQGGRIYASYPVAVAVISAPFIPPLKALTSVVRWLIHPQPTSPVLRAFFAGDFVASYGLVEMLIASALMALAAGVHLLIALEFLPLPLASLLTFIFALATPVWSTASRSMGNQTPALLMLITAVWLVVLARRCEKFATYAAIPLALAFMMRPTTAIAVALLSIYVGLHYRRRLASYVAVAAPFAILFFGYNLCVRHHLFQRYFTDPGAWPPASFPERFGLQLVSPSRGLFIFSPVLLFSFYGIWLAWRRRWLHPLAPWLAAIIGGQILLVSKYYWPGYSYGPRYFTEIIPLLTIFLIPVFQEWSAFPRAWKALFFLTLAWSVFVHARGATSFVVHQWNGTPTEVDTVRVWDWHDPQFLRGLY